MSDIQIEQQEFRIIINSSEASLYELPGSAPEAFPEIEPPNDFSTDIPTGGFDQALAAVGHCVPRDSTRIWLNGVRIEPNDDGLIFSATDGHRLARYHLKNINRNSCWPIPGVTVDIGPLNTALHCAVGGIRAAADDSSMWIDTGDTRWRIILRDDAWPDLNRILRTPTITPCQVNGADLLSALRRLNLMVNKESHSIQIEHSSENLILRVINESGQGTERLSCSSSPEKIWACDIRYLIDAIGASPSQNIMLDVLDAENAIIISSPDAPEWISAIMPQRMD